MGLTPEQMMGLGELENKQMATMFGGAGTAANIARVAEGVRSSRDMVEIDGIKVPRAQAPQMISATADAKYKSGKLSNEDFMLETTKALKESQRLYYQASAAGDKKRAEYYGQQASALATKLKAIEQFKDVAYEDLTPANFAAMGLTPGKPIAPDIEIPSNVYKVLERNFIQPGMLGQAKAMTTNSFEQFEAAKRIMGELHTANPKVPYQKIIDVATDRVRGAEARYWEAFYTLENNQDKQRLKEEFYKRLGYVPTEDKSKLSLGSQ